MDKKLDTSENAPVYSGTHDELGTSYRSVSKAAVGGFIFSLLGIVFLAASILVLLPVVGLGLSLVAVSNIRRYPEELVGRKLARIGLFLSILVLTTGLAWHSYIYMTEVPDGYERISYRMLKDDKKTDLPYSEKAEELDQTRVFLKGFVRPGTHRKNLKDFILVGDFGSCCFGGSPEITDVVAVSIKTDKRINYGWRLWRVAGTFRLNRRAAPTSEKEVPKVFYQIDADIVR